VAEEELRQQNDELEASVSVIEGERARYRDLFESAPYGFVISNASGILADANLAAISMLGAGKRDIVGKPLRLFASREDSALFFDCLKRAAEKEQRLEQFEVNIKPVAGKSFPASITVMSVRWIIRDETGRHRYMVRDSGPGIPRDKAESMFLPYYRGSQTRDGGVGLSMVRKLVNAYGGEIRAYNDLGACFEFELKGVPLEA